MQGGALYERLPIFGQHLVCSLAGWRRRRTRFNAAFGRTLAAWEDLALAPGLRRRRFVLERLRHTVEHARRAVPHYRALDLPPAHASEDPEEAIPRILEALPLLDKREVIRRPESFFADDLSSRALLHGRTSGTTGSAIPLRYTRQAMVEEWVTVWRQRRLFGLQPDGTHLTFAGHSVVPFGQARPPFWRFNRPLHQTLFSIYHMSERTLPAYVDAVHALPAAYVVGYPSALHRMARALLEAGRPLRGRLRAVFSCSESVLAFQRSAIEEAFGAPLRDRYGSAEFACSMTECREGRLHLDEEFGLAELEVREQGPGWERGPLLITGLGNDAMPFLRYRVGDVATRLRGGCPCGRPGDVYQDVDGRTEDVVVTPDGREIGRLDHVFKDLREIAEAQIVQERPDRIEVRLVPSGVWDAVGEKRLLEELRQRLGPEIAIDLRPMAEIPREPGGKLRAVRSSLRRDARR